MSNFNHYPDMDHDGEHDLKDSGMFHDMMDEEDCSFHCSNYSPPLYLVRRANDDPIGKAQAKAAREAEAFAKGILLVLCGGFFFILMKGWIPLNGFTALLGLISLAGFIRTIFI